MNKWQPVSFRIKGVSIFVVNEIYVVSQDAYNVRIGLRYIAQSVDDEISVDLYTACQLECLYE